MSILKIEIYHIDISSVRSFWRYHAPLSTGLEVVIAQSVQPFIFRDNAIIDCEYILLPSWMVFQLFKTWQLPFIPVKTFVINDDIHFNGDQTLHASLPEFSVKSDTSRAGWVLGKLPAADFSSTLLTHSGIHSVDID